MIYSNIGKNNTKRCNEGLWNMLIYSCEQTLRKNRSGSVWQVRVVMWDVCLERNFSDYLSPISFFSCLVSAAWFWVEVFCFRFKRLTNQSGVALLISFDICNLTVRLRKKKLCKQKTFKFIFCFNNRPCESMEEARSPCLHLWSGTVESINKESSRWSHVLYGYSCRGWNKTE